MASGPITSWQIDGETVADLIFLGSKIAADCDCSHEIKRCLLLGRKVMTNLDCILKSRDITLPTKIRVVKAMIFPVVMCGCESWTIKKVEHWKIDAFELWCWRVETPILWPSDLKSWLTWKDPDAGKDWGQEEKGTTEDEMVGWHHRLDGHGFGWTLGVGDGQRGLACCSSWGCKGSDTTEWLNWAELNHHLQWFWSQEK